MSEEGIVTAEQPEIVDATAVLYETTNELENGSLEAPLQYMMRQMMSNKKFETEWLDLSSSVIEGKETKILARALESNQLTNLKVLFLHGNAGDVGARAMFNSLRAGHLKGLKKLILWEVSSYTQITTAEEGTDTIADALSEGLLPDLDTMDLTGTLPKLTPARMFSETIKDLLMKRSCGGGRLRESCLICLGCLVCTTDVEKNQTLECLRCQFGKLQVYSGDDGIRKIGRALKNKPIYSLRILILQQNYIRDKGAATLAKLLRRNLMPNLEELDLQNNPVTCEGAEKIVVAFLRNPLLTVRVKLDWPSPTCLLREKGAAFRDSNIRLEHRLDTLDIPRESIVVDEYKDFDYYLKRPRKQGLGKSNHRLHLLCHAQYGNGNHRFKSHKIVSEVGTEEPEGIEIRRRSTHFCHTTKKYVDRDIESESSGDEELVYETSSGDEKKEDTSGELSSKYHSATSRPSLKRQETVLKRSTGVNRIYITSNTCGFVGAAKALGSQIGRNSNPRTKIWPWRHPQKTRRQMDTIKEELLMLAERKPDEFYNMFELRQVLLRNPKQKDRYSRVWICKPCFVKYREEHMQDEYGLAVVQPLTTDAELDPRSQQSNPKPDSSRTSLSPEVNHQLTRPSSRSGLVKNILNRFKCVNHVKQDPS